MSGSRPDPDFLFMDVAALMAQRSTCLRKQIGAVLVLQRRIISTGYSGSPSGQPHCTIAGCLIPEGETGCRRTVHAELNCIAFAARHGVATEGATLYTTVSPCWDCAKAFLASGGVRLVYRECYRLDEPLRYLMDAGMAVCLLGSR